jgi:hypothetical protein
MERILLIGIVLAIAYLVQSDRGRPLGSTYTSITLILVGIALVGIHVGSDTLFGIEASQTWRGLTLEALSFLVPLAYGLICGGVALGLRQALRR